MVNSANILEPSKKQNAFQIQSGKTKGERPILINFHCLYSAGRNYANVLLNSKFSNTDKYTKVPYFLELFLNYFNM